MSALKSAALVGILLIAFAAGLISGKNGAVGGVYSTVAQNVPALVVKNPNTAATTTVELGKVCYTVTTASGNTLYAFFSAANGFATSSVSCN